jgi:thiamine biosynthesis lipoprotein
MKRIYPRALLSLLLATMLLVLPSCHSVHTAEDVVWHMDTAITLRLYGDQAATAAALQDANTLLASLDDQLSSTKTGNEIAAINQAAQDIPVPLSDELSALIARADTISHVCGGAFDITVAPLNRLWKNCEIEGVLPTKKQLAIALSAVGHDKLTLNGNTLIKADDALKIDLGGIGKGYAIDRLIAELRIRPGISGGLISFGSNVAVFGEKPDGKPFIVAIRDPKDAAGVLGYVTLTEGQVLSVSGDYERYYTIGEQTYGHILDPATGYPPTNGLCSVAVIAADGTLADALSTAFMVMGEDAARALYEDHVLDFEAIFVYDTTVSKTDGFVLQ